MSKEVLPQGGQHCYLMSFLDSVLQFASVTQDSGLDETFFGMSADLLDSKDQYKQISTLCPVCILSSPSIGHFSV